MAFKKPYNKENLKKNGIRVKNSYYTFSKDYPIGNLTKRKVLQKKEKFRLVQKIGLLTFCFVFISLLSFFFTSVGLKFSYKAPLEDTSSLVQTENEQSEKQNVRAFFLPAEKIGDTAYIKRLISKIKINDATSVVVDFKTKDGRLAYSSKSEYAIGTDAPLFDNETLREALSLFKSKKIDVIAQIYCFEDPLVSAEKSELAVKYLNTDVSWLDESETEIGKTWLNPYSKKARAYLFDVIKEASAFGVKGFILKGVSFPNSGALEKATYPGEKDKADRNKVLLDFIKKAKTEASKNCFVLVSQSVDEITNPSTAYLFGSLTSSTADGISADLSSRDEQYVIDKKTDYSSILSLMSKLKTSIGEKDFIFEISEDEFSRRFLRTASKSGYDNFIVY